MTSNVNAKPAPEAVRAAEAAAQRSVCVIPDGDMPEALIEALDRRVEVNLAQATSDVVVRAGGSDPQVRALEAPFSRRKAPEPIPAPKNRGSHRRRATKKAPAKKKENP